MTLEQPQLKKQKFKKVAFEIINRTQLNVDDTFLLRLKPSRKERFYSGDLLTIFPTGTDVTRQYSIARLDDQILLSIKKHPLGRGSSYLHSLKAGDVIKAAITHNPNFYFPSKKSDVILISNGTGIIPFLGMLQGHLENKTHLFWGGRTQESTTLYKPILDVIESTNSNLNLYTCFSKENNKQYVQELLSKHYKIVLQTLKNDGVIMICGSHGMQQGVLHVIEQLVQENLHLTLDILMHRGQLKMDCY